MRTEEEIKDAIARMQKAIDSIPTIPPFKRAATVIHRSLPVIEILKWVLQDHEEHPALTLEELVKLAQIAASVKQAAG